MGSATIIRQSFSQLLLLFVLLTTTANGFCPSKCICYGDANNLKAKCIDAGLIVVPLQLNPNVKHINLTDNKIATVHFTLSFYYMLETLDISKNVLESLGMKNSASQGNLRKTLFAEKCDQKILQGHVQGNASVGGVRLEL
jgi:hypothetical protein